MPTVLIVDDEPNIRAIVSLALQGEGFEVIEAQDGPSALEFLGTRAPDIMILDIMMPGMDGFEVLATMRHQGLAPATRVVIMTCRTAERDHLRGWELGADEYLTKPFDADVLAESLRRLILSTPEALRSRRTAELEKAALLDRLELSMRRPVRRRALATNRP